MVVWAWLWLKGGTGWSCERGYGQMGIGIAFTDSSGLSINRLNLFAALEPITCDAYLQPLGRSQVPQSVSIRIMQTKPYSGSQPF